jgi:hypothetical protein
MPVLNATKILKAILETGFVPNLMVAIGPHDKLPGVTTAGRTLKESLPAGANRILACVFEPQGERAEQAAVQDTINAIIGETRGKLMRRETKTIGSLAAQLVELRVMAPPGIALSVHVAAFVGDGMVYRYSLTTIESKAAEARAALEEFLAAASL